MNKTLKFSKDDIKKLIDSLCNNEDNKDDVIITFNVLFPDLDTSTIERMESMLNKMDSQFGNNDGNLTIEDFKILEETIKNNKLIALSFFITMTIEGLYIYKPLKDTIKNMSASDFIFRAIVYIIIVSLIKTNKNNTKKIILDNKENIVNIISTVHNVYTLFVESKDGFKKVYELFFGKTGYLRCKSCTRPQPDQTIIKENQNSHNEIVINAIQAMKIKNNQ